MYGSNILPNNDTFNSVVVVAVGVVLGEVDHHFIPY
jgi:hypothetical protein